MCQNCAATAHNDGLYVMNKLYDGYETPSIVRKAITLTGDTSTASKAEYHFDETVFPSLGGDKNKDVQVERQELSWFVPTVSHLDLSKHTK